MLISALWRNDSVIHIHDFPGGSDSKESACSAGDPGLIPGSEKGMATHSSILAWNLSGYSPWGCKESDVTERLTLTG